MQLRHLVVVIPGIGGSVLENDRGSVWSTQARDLVEALREPDRLALNRSLRPVGLINDLVLFPGWALVPGYDRLVSQIVRTFEDVRLDLGHPEHVDADANAALFPYDFRQSVSETARDLDRFVRFRVNRLFGMQAVRRVIVVAHSLGGLVARYWLGPLGGWRFCRALITAGTPHRGAPKGLDWLVNGIDGKVVRLRAASEVIRTWPSALELLPRYRAVRDLANGGAARYPHEIAAAVGLSETASRRAFDVHEEIARAWESVPSPPEGPDVVPLVGIGHRTIEWSSWDGRRLAAETTRPDWLYESDLRGDGTVPSVSAVPLELSESRSLWRTPGERHLNLASWEGIIQLLLQYSVEGFGEVRGAPLEPRREVAPQIGLGLDESFAAGSPVSVAAFLRPPDVDTSRARLWVRLEPHESRQAEVRSLEMTRVGEEWSAELAGLDPGFYDVSVFATDVTPEPAPARDSIAVVAP